MLAWLKLCGLQSRAERHQKPVRSEWVHINMDPSHLGQPSTQKDCLT